jgi:excisionase family DNA binding protein
MDKGNTLPKYQSDYLTRLEVSSLFKISLVTVYQWTQSGVLRAYRLGSRVYFKRSEIEASLTVIEPKRATAKPLHKGVSNG